MAEQNKSVAIVLLPSDDSWCRQEFAHTTLVYVGDDIDLNAFLLKDALVKMALVVSTITSPFLVEVSGIEVFGDEERVDVLALEPRPKLLAVRELFLKWDNLEFPDYKPHATIGPAFGPRQNIPIALLFDRICVWWGDEKVIFWLKGLNH